MEKLIARALGKARQRRKQRACRHAFMEIGPEGKRVGYCPRCHALKAGSGSREGRE